MQEQHRVARALVDVVHPQPVLLDVVRLEVVAREPDELLIGRAVDLHAGQPMTGAPSRARRSIRSAARTVPGDACTRAGDRGHAAAEHLVREQPVDRAEQLAVLELVGREPDAETRLVDPLRVVVLIPEERQRDHRLAEMEALRRRVVPAVRDHEVDERQDRRLRQELLAPHVLGELVLGVLRTLGDDEAVRRARQHVDEPSSSGRRPPSRGCRATGRRARLPCGEAARAATKVASVRADARIEPVPRRPERRAAPVVGFARVRRRG